MGARYLYYPVKTLFLALALLTQDDPHHWLGSDTVVSLPDKPALVMVPRPGSPRVALRWFVPLQETDEEAGAGEVLVTLAGQRAISHAARIGASFAAVRTPMGIAYTVAGARVDLDHLFNILRIAADPPETDPILLRRAVAVRHARLEREQESAERSLVARLTQSLCPGHPPRSGTFESVDALDAPTLRRLWEESHRPGPRSMLVVVGDVPLAVVLASLPPLGTASGRRAPAGRLYAPDRLTRSDRAQVLRQWYGQAWPTGPATDPRSVVAARLLGEAVQDLDVPFDVTMEFVDAGCSSALVVVGAAYRQNARALRTTIQSVLGQVRERITEEQVARIALELERGLLARAVTEEGAADLIGTFLEAGQPAASFRGFLDGLLKLDRLAMVEFIDRLLTQTPLRAELDP